MPGEYPLCGPPTFRTLVAYWPVRIPKDQNRSMRELATLLSSENPANICSVLPGNAFCASPCFRAQSALTTPVRSAASSKWFEYFKTKRGNDLTHLPGCVGHKHWGVMIRPLADDGRACKLRASDNFRNCRAKAFVVPYLAAPPYWGRLGSQRLHCCREFAD